MNKTYKTWKFILLMLIIVVINVILLIENTIKLIFIITLPIILSGLIISIKCKIIIGEDEVMIYFATFSENKLYRKSSIKGLIVKYNNIKKIELLSRKKNIFYIELLDGNRFYFYTNMFFKKDINNIKKLILLRTDIV